MRITICLIYLTLLSSNVFSQGEANIWCFGSKAGLDFNYIPPKPLSDIAMFAAEGCASISDEEGNLLFYTNGIIVWNSQHDTMENGYDLYGNQSSVQSAMIVKDPYNSSEYFIFTADGGGGSRGLNYSKVDMTANAGLGKLWLKNSPLQANSSEMVTAVPHQNGKDIWVIGREKSSPRFHAYLISSAGITTSSVLSVVAANVSKFGLGTLKSSSDGRMVAFVDYNAGLTLMDFDQSTGSLSNPKQILEDTNKIFYGVEFSPCNQFLYATYTDITDHPKLYRKVSQFDITSSNLTDIINSEYLVTSDITYNAAIQAASDGRIYLIGEVKTLGVINEPDREGPLCDFKHYGQTTVPGSAAAGLPNFYVNDISKGYIRVQNACAGVSTILTYRIKNTSVDSVRWSLGDINNSFSTEDTATFSYATAGVYNIQLLIFIGGDTMRMRNKLEVLGQFEVGLRDTQICSTDKYNIDLYTYELDSVRWNDGDDTMLKTIEGEGQYWLAAYKRGCRSEDTVQLSYIPKPDITLDIDTQLCDGDSLEVLLLADSSGYEFVWSDGTLTQQRVIKDAGFYEVEMQPKGCAAAAVKGTVMVRYYPALPQLNLGADTTICSSEPGIIEALYDGYYGLIWQDGTLGRYYTVNSSDTLIVSTTPHVCGQISDTIYVTYYNGDCRFYIPSAFTPNGDGLNDSFFPVGINITVKNMQIFSRWGELIYSGIASWDGTYEGSVVPNGVYLYTVIYIDKSGLRKYTRGVVQVLK